MRAHVCVKLREVGWGVGWGGGREEREGDIPTISSGLVLSCSLWSALSLPKCRCSINPPLLSPLLYPVLAIRIVVVVVGRGGREGGEGNEVREGKGGLLSWCLKPSQPQRIIPRLKGDGGQGGKRACGDAQCTTTGLPSFRLRHCSSHQSLTSPFHVSVCANTNGHICQFSNSDRQLVFNAQSTM